MNATSTKDWIAPWIAGFIINYEVSLWQDFISITILVASKLGVALYRINHKCRRYVVPIAYNWTW